LIPKFQDLGCKGLEFGGLGLKGLGGLGLESLRGLGLRGLEFESLVSDPSILDPRPGLGGSRPEIFLGFDFPRALTWVGELLGLTKVDP
jgi:hypothetical protein